MPTIEIIDDGPGDETTATYNYRVLVNSREIAEGVVKNYCRALGWQGLVKAVAGEAERRNLAVMAEAWHAATRGRIDEVKR